MKSTGIVRRVDVLGRVVIPKELRERMDFNCGKEIAFSVKGEEIILNRYIRGCVFCHSIENISMFKGKRVCSECQKILKHKY